MKLIIVDIGNTNTRIAVIEHQEIHEKISFPTSDHKSHEAQIKLFYESLSAQKIRPIVICSVVPETANRLMSSCELSLDIHPLLIGKDIPLPLSLDLKNTKTVGADRVVSAGMAYSKIEKCVAVASFGTAITVDCVSDEGVFLGGTIFPGLQLSAKALSENTAQLPLVSLEISEGPFGKTTEEAIANGIIFSTVGALREIVERFATALGKWPEVIVTGGDASLIAAHCDFIHAIVPDLLLLGIESAFEKWYQGNEDK
jgi:type III pantothenate kinase